MQGTPNDQNFDPAQKTNGELSEDLHSKGTAQPTNGNCHSLFLTLLTISLSNSHRRQCKDA